MNRTLRLIKWIFLSILVGVVAGIASGFFLKSLVWVTVFRETHIWILALLPVAGLFVGWLYQSLGKEVEAGNNLIMEEVHDPKMLVPFRMAPLILASTLITHLFGGSAGREGTAVQMGGSLADQLHPLFKLKPEERRILLMAGMSAGFGSVFGTPLAGCIFGMEVLTVGHVNYDALLPCFLASVIGDQTTRLFGVSHMEFVIDTVPHFSLTNLGWALFVGALFGLVGRLFVLSSHGINHLFKEKIKNAPLRPFISGIIIGALVLSFRYLDRYIGIGDEGIASAFAGTSQPWDFIAKLLFTALTLGSGFKGGEVTPLFFIGATFGQTLSAIIPLPGHLLAGMGFVAVFAGAANVPVSCLILAMELFGSRIGIYAGVACVMSYLFSGHAGIYSSQRPDLKFK